MTDPTDDTGAPPRLSLSHATLAVRDLDRMLAFYRDVLGFRLTNRGQVGDGTEMAFISQDPAEHHQIVLVAGVPTGDPGFTLTDHLAFRTGSLDDLRAVGAALADAGVDDVIPVSHGNAWSLYFTDPEGNGLECFVDSPFHVAQPHGGGLDLGRTDAEVEAATRAEIESLPEFAPVEQWRTDFEAALAGDGRRADGVDLGIAGRRAIVCASSRGLGFACADSLGREGVDLWVNGRDAEALDAAASDLRDRHGVSVTAVVGDIGDEATRDALLDRCPEPDIVVNNNGGPDPGRFQDWDREAWIAALDANMLAPVLLIRAVVDGMVERRFGRIVNITSAMVKTPISAMGLSTGARTGLTSVAKALSRDVAAANVTVNNLLPERFDTDRQRQMAELHAALGDISVDEAYERMAETIAAKRLGRPDELGDACAFLCSAQAGYLSGQSIQLDGGSYEGLL